MCLEPLSYGLVMSRSCSTKGMPASGHLSGVLLHISRSGLECLFVIYRRRGTQHARTRPRSRRRLAKTLARSAARCYGLRGLVVRCINVRSNFCSALFSWAALAWDGQVIIQLSTAPEEPAVPASPSTPTSGGPGGDSGSGDRPNPPLRPEPEPGEPGTPGSHPTPEAPAASWWKGGRGASMIQAFLGLAKSSALSLM